MYSYTPTNKFLVLSPTQSGPDASINVDQAQYDTAAPRVRSDSYSSTSNNGEAQLKDTWSPLPGGFLYLGHDAPARTASTE